MPNHADSIIDPMYSNVSHIGKITGNSPFEFPIDLD